MADATDVPLPELLPLPTGDELMDMTEDAMNEALAVRAASPPLVLPVRAAPQNCKRSALRTHVLSPRVSGGRRRR